MPAQQTLQKKSLFGGAFTFAIPKEYQDASELRQIPDTQEVFLDSATNNSIIIEVLESTKEKNDRLLVHWHDISEYNESKRYDVLRTFPAKHDKNGVAVESLVGLQVNSKFNRQDFDFVLVFMALFALDEFDTDLLVTFHVVLRENAENYDDYDDVKQTCLDAKQDTIREFNAILDSFELNDTSIFVNQ